MKEAIPAEAPGAAILWIIGIMEKKMETAMVYWGYIGIMEN